jgi:putative oxidoreductase
MNVTATFAANSQGTAATTRDAAELGGRILLSSLFVLSGLSKIGGYAATAGYMAALGVPAALLPIVIALELGGGLAIAFGWKTRVVAFLLGGFTMVAALVFHSNFADQVQQIMFLKNVSISGAFLMLVANGAGAWSLDRYLAK